MRAAMEAWNAGDRSEESLARYFDPSVTLDSPISELSGKPFRGYDGLRRWTGDIDDQFSEWRVGLDDIREVEGRVIAITNVAGRGQASGIALEFTSASVFEFASDGRVSRMRIYNDVREALKAVGLEE